MADDKGYGFKVVTQYSPELIAQHIEPYGGDALSLRHETTVRLLQLQEEGVRQALIALGWTPPPRG